MSCNTSYDTHLLYLNISEREEGSHFGKDENESLLQSLMQGLIFPGQQAQQYWEKTLRERLATRRSRAGKESSKHLQGHIQ